jgi:hypothetical protein
MSAKQQCEYLDRAGNPNPDCLGEFEKKKWNQIYCANCRPLATRDRGAKFHESEDPEKISKRNKRRRQKAAEAAGRAYREMSEMQPCLYRDRNGEPGPECLGKFKPASGIQIYCKNCTSLARRDRQAKAALALYQTLKKQHEVSGVSPGYDKRLEWGRKSARNYHGRQRELVALAKRRPRDWWARRIDWRIIADVLLSSEGYMPNEELAQILDASRILKCPYGVTWKSALSRAGRAMNYISEIRTWAGRPGKTPRAKRPSITSPSILTKTVESLHSRL